MSEARAITCGSLAIGTEGINGVRPIPGFSSITIQRVGFEFQLQQSPV